MNMNRIKTLVIVILAAVMALSAVGMAAAQDPGDGNRPERRGGRGGAFHDIVIQTIADELGIDPSELVLDPETDQTLRDIILANGGDPYAISATVVAAVTDHVNEQILAGDLTAERGDEILSDLDTRVADALDRTPSTLERDGRGFGQIDILEVVSAELGLSTDDIRTALQSGQTLDDIIAENGGDVDAITAALVADATQNINDAVTEGRITQEQADEILQNIDERVNNALTQPRPADRPNGPDGRGNGPRGQRGGQGQGPNGGQPPVDGQQPPNGAGQPPANDGQAPNAPAGNAPQYPNN